MVQLESAEAMKQYLEENFQIPRTSLMEEGGRLLIHAVGANGKKFVVKVAKFNTDLYRHNYNPELRGISGEPKWELHPDFEKLLIHGEGVQYIGDGSTSIHTTLEAIRKGICRIVQ